MGTTVQSLTVPLGEKAYPIWIGDDLLANIAFYLQRLPIDTNRKLLIVTDEQVDALYGHGLQQRLADAGYSVWRYAVPAGESSKSLQVYEQVITYALEQKLDRKSVVLALGGGVVGDLAGFVASTFMRGIPFVQLPTTLLAHDSSVGGKVAINHTLGKNLIGAFYQPLAVIYDTKTLATLPKRQIRSGFAEVLKHAFIQDADFAEWLWIYRKPCLALEEPYISKAIGRACAIKSAVVAEDEKEQGRRAILNYGHTFAHAFEALGKYGALTHGEAVSIGMVLAAKVSEYVYEKNDLAEQVIRLLEAYGLPVSWQQLPWDVQQVIDKMYADKKAVGNALNLVLMPEIGRAELVRDVEPALIVKAWSSAK